MAGVVSGSVDNLMQNPALQTKIAHFSAGYEMRFRAII
jgi:hypothetical protein